MSTCGDDGLERDLPDLASGGADGQAPDGDAAILVKRPSEEHALTARDDRDVHSAITNGLASYLLQLRRSHAGRDMRILSAIADWPDRDDGNRPLPSAGVHTEEDGVYEDSGLTPGKPDILDDSDPRAVLSIAVVATYRLSELKVEIACADKVEREGVRRMLEDASNPHHWMGGFRLVLPSYHNAIAEFTLTSMRFGDDGETVVAGVRWLIARFSAWCPVYRLHRLPLARPQTRGNIVTRG